MFIFVFNFKLTRCDHEATTKWPRSDHEVTGKWPWCDHEATTKRPRSDHEATTKWSRNDHEAATSDHGATTERPRNDHEAIFMFIFHWLVFNDNTREQRRYDCRSGSLPEILQYRVWPVSRTETFNTQVHWPISNNNTRKTMQSQWQIYASNFVVSNISVN